MLYAFLGLAVFGLITSSVVTCLVLTTVPVYLRERRRALARLASGPAFTPPLSLLKPLHGAEAGLEGYLESFFTQDYPNYEILFCARTADDAGLAVARAVAARYPQIPVKFLWTEGQPDYINAKAASMERMEAEVAHEILVISDSDVRVVPDYLRSVALPFADERVGGVTCPYRGVAAEGDLWARIEAVGMSVEMTAGVLVARRMEGMQFTLGPTMAFRRETIRHMGGFAVTADYCADDFILGNETWKRGEAVVLSHHVIEHFVIHSSFRQTMLHQVRWMKSTRFSRPMGHLGTSLTFAMPYGLLGLLVALAFGHWRLGLGLFAWALASRLAISISVGRLVVRDRNWGALLVLYPIRDFVGFFVWASSYFSGRIHWRGRIYELLPGGRMRAAQ